jgi:two-component system response regulator NreC
VIRIVIVDDHPVVRAGVKAFLSDQADLQVIGEAGDGLEGLKLVERLKPDVIVLDLSVPGLNGFEVARQVHQRFPLIRVVILSAHSDEAYVLQALRCGVSAYILKDAISTDLDLAIRKAMAGQRTLSPALSERAIDAYMEKARQVPETVYDTLSSREREVFLLLAEGLTTSEVATRLSLSSRTVETHRASILHKLNLRNQAQLVRYAIEQQIILPKNPQLQQDE